MAKKMIRPNLVNESRRAFLKSGAVAGGALVIGCYLPSSLVSVANAQAQGSDTIFKPNVWIRIGPDDYITIMLSLLELGQGAMTGMPMLVAEELDADWNRIKLEWVGVDPAYGRPEIGGSQQTTGSRSIRAYWKRLREAGAAGRSMLVTAAAQQWGVTEDSCRTENGEVIHDASGRRVRYGALVEKASLLPIPEKVALKNVNNFRILGHSMARLDIPQKVNGSAVYGMDVKRPNMLITRVLRCPVFVGTIAGL